ncbi:MAG: hypothetical protein KBB94_01395 [Legionellaceae bacterium]|nr:hypothetical protein [Legionellaceae bacterium]MBP9774641.1 hypothetical protein [Legionellaceae bacterium]
MFFSHKANETHKNLDSVRAFTYLCKHIKFSLVGNAVTFYPDMSVFTRKMVVSVLKKLHKDPELSHKDVYRQYLEHAYYHKDEFEWEPSHYHWHFTKTLDQALLTKILDCFLEKEFITPEEKQGFLAAFQQANLMPVDDFESLITQDCLEQLYAVIHKTYAQPKDSHLHSMAQAVWEDLARLTATGKKLSTIRHYINAVKFVLTNPNDEHISYMRKLAEDAAQSWPSLSAALFILGAALMTTGACLGLGVPGLVVGIVGGGLFLLGAKKLCDSDDDDSAAIHDEQFSQDLLALSAAAA